MLLLTVDPVTTTTTTTIAEPTLCLVLLCSALLCFILRVSSLLLISPFIDPSSISVLVFIPESVTSCHHGTYHPPQNQKEKKEKSECGCQSR